MEQYYEDFKAHLFHRREEDGDWYWSNGLFLGVGRNALSLEQKLVLTERLLLSYESELSGYSNWQLAKGMAYLFTMPDPEIGYALASRSTPFASRARVVKVIRKLFQRQGVVQFPGSFYGLYLKEGRH